MRIDTCVHMRAEICVGTGLDLRADICVKACVWACVHDMCVGHVVRVQPGLGRVFVDRELCMHIDMCVGMCVGICVDICVGMCLDMCVDTCV